ncbi:MAG: Copper homeostasis protein CutC [Bacteroidetes bacterium ADurb.Bin013]|jgi:copper homeostasis protein CutC|nr:MAG: Copper homeostasis protein CutC [Bacteroidetes bacterium ADurb.Bin013]
MILLEACCTSIESAQAMLQAGAHRVELCSALECGGLTPVWLSRLRDDPALKEPLTVNPIQTAPSLGNPTQTTPFSDNPLQLSGKSFLDRAHVLIRCRPGNFCYSQAEVDAMCQSIRLCRQVGVRGVVIGALTPDGNPDLPALRQMIRTATGSAPLDSDTAPLDSGSAPLDSDTAPLDTGSALLDSDTAPLDTGSAPLPSGREQTSFGHATARPLRIVFHRAFDECKYPLETLEILISMGFHTLLTSGQAPTAEEGIPVLKQLVEKAAGRITIMAGKGITLNNVAQIAIQTRVPAIHLSERPGWRRISEILRQTQQQKIAKS